MHTYAISDLHGKYFLWRQIEAELKDDDVLYCLGDCIDRGPDGISIVDAIRTRPNTYYIKGNHEDMAAAALPGLIAGYFGSSAELWYGNGGEITWESLKDRPSDEQWGYVRLFEGLKTRMTYVNRGGTTILLDHAGFTPGGEVSPLWNREHFDESWPEGCDDTIIVHGHTPVQFLSASGKMHLFTFHRNRPKIRKYCGGHKIDIDLGSYASNVAALLDLDTLRAEYFYSDPAW